MTSGLHKGRQTGEMRGGEEPRAWVMGRENAGEGVRREGGCALDVPVLSCSSFSPFFLLRGWSVSLRCAVLMSWKNAEKEG